MNKKLLLNLLLLLLAISLVSCGETNNASKASVSPPIDNTKETAKDSIKPVSPPAEDEAKSKESNSSPEKTIPENNQDQIPTETNEKKSTENGVLVVTHSNTIKDLCEFDLADINATTQITPLNDEGTSPIVIKNNDNSYIDVIINLTNLSNKAILPSGLTSGKVKIKNTEYACFSVAENADSTDLAGDALINPMEMRRIHYVAEVPKTEAKGQLEFTLTINGKDYSNKFMLY